MAWSNSFDPDPKFSLPNDPKVTLALKRIVETGWDVGKIGIDLATQPDKTVLSKGSHHVELKGQGSNLVDQDQNLYFQCSDCQQLFDPVTKSFKTLHDKAHAAGWKIKWNVDGMGYKIRCKDCS